MKRPGTAKTLAVALMLLVPAGVGMATLLEPDQTDGNVSTTSAPPPVTEDATASQEASTSTYDASSFTMPEGEVLETYEQSFSQPVETGALDLRIDRGAVRVVGWAQDAYKVVVLQEPTQGAEANDFEVQATFDDASQGDHLDLTLTVVQKGTVGVGTQVNDQGTQDPTPEVAIVALVPSSASYEEVQVCSGHLWALEERFEEVDWWPFDEDAVNVDEICTGHDDTASASVNVGHVRVMSGEHPEGLNVTFGVENLEGEALELYAEHQDVHVAGLNFAQAAFLLESGDVHGSHLAGSNHTVLTEYGDVSLGNVAVADLRAWSNSGDVTVDLVPRTTGTVDLLSEHGEIVVEVMRRGVVGVEMDAGTDYGDIVVQLTDAKVERNEEAEGNWQDPGYWTGWLQDDGSYEHKATAETRGFDGDPVHLTLQAFTDSGDILVTDGSAPAMDDPDEER